MPREYWKKGTAAVLQLPPANVGELCRRIRLTGAGRALLVPEDTPEVFFSTTSEESELEQTGTLVTLNADSIFQLQSSLTTIN